MLSESIVLSMRGMPIAVVRGEKSASSSIDFAIAEAKTV
jgi:hypothetical protein